MNAFCQQVIANEGKRKRCDKLERVLKHLMESRSVTGYTFNCHQGVNNCLIRHAAKKIDTPSTKREQEDPNHWWQWCEMAKRDWFIFIGQVLVKEIDYEEFNQPYFVPVEDRDAVLPSKAYSWEQYTEFLDKAGQFVQDQAISLVTKDELDAFRRKVEKNFELFLRCHFFDRPSEELPNQQMPGERVRQEIANAFELFEAGHTRETASQKIRALLGKFTLLRRHSADAVPNAAETISALEELLMTIGMCLSQKTPLSHGYLSAVHKHIDKGFGGEIACPRWGARICDFLQLLEDDLRQLRKQVQQVDGVGNTECGKPPSFWPKMLENDAWKARRNFPSEIEALIALSHQQTGRLKRGHIDSNSNRFKFDFDVDRGMRIKWPSSVYDACAVFWSGIGIGLLVAVLSEGGIQVVWKLFYGGESFIAISLGALAAVHSNWVKNFVEGLPHLFVDVDRRDGSFIRERCGNYLIFNDVLRYRLRLMWRVLFVLFVIIIICSIGGGVFGWWPASPFHPG